MGHAHATRCVHLYRVHLYAPTASGNASSAYLSSDVARAPLGVSRWRPTPPSMAQDAITLSWVPGRNLAPNTFPRCTEGRSGEAGVGGGWGQPSTNSVKQPTIRCKCPTSRALTRARTHAHMHEQQPERLTGSEPSHALEGVHSTDPPHLHVAVVGGCHGVNNNTEAQPRTTGLE
jgi:hypothetical protein